MRLVCTGKGDCNRNYEISMKMCNYTISKCDYGGSMRLGNRGFRNSVLGFKVFRLEKLEVWG